MRPGCDIGEISSPKIRRLFDYWTAKRGPHPMPYRRDIDPVELKSLLPELSISEFETDPFRVRYRLVGTRVAEIAGFNYTGFYLDEIDFGAGDHEDWMGQYAWIVENRTPIFGHSATPFRHGGGEAEFEYTALPLTADGTTVFQCLELEDYGVLDPVVMPTLERTSRIGAETARSGGKEPASPAAREPGRL